MFEYGLLLSASTGQNGYADAGGCSYARAPVRRVVENKHSNRSRSATYLQSEWAFIRVDSDRRFNVGRVLVLK